MRIVKHSARDAMPTCWPPNDQGRDLDYDDAGTPRGGAIGGLMLVLAFWLVVGIVLVVVGSAS